VVVTGVSYEPDGSGFRISYLANFDKAGAGGLYTTLADLAKWDANFYRPDVGGDALLKTLLTRGVLANGDTLDYAFGLTLGRLLGRPIVRHGGAIIGFRAGRCASRSDHHHELCNLGDRPGALAIG
jgi:CubicO group peptidase (beta-lactamase class C family)